MRAIEFTRDKYPRYTDDEIIEKYCPKEVIEMDFSNCLSFEYCNTCWDQEVEDNENTKQK